MKTIKYILFLCCIAIFASCYEDEGNYDYPKIRKQSQWQSQLQ